MQSIFDRNEQYRRLTVSKNEVTKNELSPPNKYVLSTLKDGQWTERLRSPWMSTLLNKGEDWMDLNMIDDYSVKEI